MLYLVHDPETGKLIQTNKIYGDIPKDYDDRVTALGQHFIKMKGTKLPSMNHHSIDLLTKTLIPRPEMPGALNKMTIKADDKDQAIVTGLPKPCRVTVKTGGIAVALNEEITDGEVVICSAVPAIYRIWVTAFPHQERYFEVTAQ
jgi:hypothetical protein